MYWRISDVREPEPQRIYQRLDILDSLPARCALVGVAVARVLSEQGILTQLPWIASFSFEYNGPDTPPCADGDKSLPILLFFN